MTADEPLLSRLALKNPRLWASVCTAISVSKVRESAHRAFAKAAE
ncbi:hypothetical protein OHT76_04210 [Streptomyces sp. NBC_00287]|nr:hypothetical protein [Streptomyces sp. NBC_00287]